MTELIYQYDSYIRQFEAMIIQADLNQHAVVLDRTAFYPGGGGQPCDTGSLRTGNQEIPVIRTRNTEIGALHFLDSTFPVPGHGTPVYCKIDWDKRYKLMRTHTALHILCGVVFRDYGALVTGGDMSPLEGRMDFEFETMQKDLVQAIELAVNNEVQNDRTVKVKVLPRQEAFQIPDLIRTKINLLPEGIQEIRTVEIVGLDLQADGGTHVNSTQEVGKITIKDYKSKGKINKRIYISLE